MILDRFFPRKKKVEQAPVANPEKTIDSALEDRIEYIARKIHLALCEPSPAIEVYEERRKLDKHHKRLVEMGKLNPLPKDLLSLAIQKSQHAIKPTAEISSEQNYPFVGLEPYFRRQRIPKSIYGKTDYRLFIRPELYQDQIGLKKHRGSVVLKVEDYGYFGHDPELQSEETARIWQRIGTEEREVLFTYFLEKKRESYKKYIRDNEEDEEDIKELKKNLVDLERLIAAYKAGDTEVFYDYEECSLGLKFKNEKIEDE